MQTLTFNSLRFQTEKEHIKIFFMNQFYTKIPIQELNNIDFVKADNNTITFQNNSERKFNQLLNKHLLNLKTIRTNNNATYIHQFSQIPLIGNGSFGIVYRNNSTIEIKPQTSCNLNCIYCSVSEGTESTQNDFVIEMDYLLQELSTLLNYIQEPAEIHIGVQGEPFLYKDLMELIENLNKDNRVKIISIDTNATLITTQKIETISNFKKLRLNISLDAVDPELAKKISGPNYNLNHILNIIKQLKQKQINFLIAPLYLPNINDQELIKIINFAKELKIKTPYPLVCIQNFLEYKTGKKPTKTISWDKFKAKLKQLEDQTNTRLIIDLKKDFQIKETKSLPKPFKKDDTIKAKIVSKARFKNTMLASYKNRNITVINCNDQINKIIKLKILKDKHNIFLAKKV